MSVNLASGPYYDDFDEAKDFHQILFRPGYAVQARELTQSQSILRDQISKFGNHIFSHGSIVIPGNSTADLYVPYIEIKEQHLGVDILLSNFEGQTVVGVTSGVEAVVKKIVPSTNTDPIIFYLSYISGNVASNSVVFIPGENIFVKIAPAIIAETELTVGQGSLAHINKGVYYINGSFVNVYPQTIVISKFTSTPSCHVLLKINEQTITSETDSTLLDPAQGSYNFAAPGSDRLKISLELISLPLGTTISSDYVEIMRYNDGNLEAHSKNPKYSELEKSLARRTFDESGNYVVSGLVPVVREHNKTKTNNGVYVSGDTDKLVIDVIPGKAYINGFEVEQTGSTKITIDKARTADHIDTMTSTLRPEYGQYIIISNLLGGLNINTRQTISFYNDNDPGNVSATLLGTAAALGIEYYAGDVGGVGGALYKLWVTDVTLAFGKTLSEAGGIRFSGGSAYVLTKYSAPILSLAFTVSEVVSHSSGRTATVKYWDTSTSTLYVYKHDHTKLTPNVGDKITGGSSGTVSDVTMKISIVSVGQSSMIFRLPTSAVSSLLNSSLVYDLNYTVQKEILLSTNGAGDGSATISSGVIAPITVSSMCAFYASGVVQNSKFSLNVGGNTISATGGPPSTTIHIYTMVEKTNVSPKTKTAVTATDVFTTVTSTLTLSKADVTSLISIIDTVGDITANYTLFSGQTDYSYGLGKVILKPGAPSPVGNVSVNYNYYQHSLSGDFFCADSYSSVANYLDNITVYSSESTASIYDLLSCVDFRPTVGSDGTFSSGSARPNDLILPDNIFSTHISYFIPRVDSLVMSVSGKLSVITGIPAVSPVAPNIPPAMFEIYRFLISAYTKSFRSVYRKKLDIERFTMRDIKGLSNRIARVEDYATLNADEFAIANYNIIDATTGLNRYKTGFIVENFTSPLTIANTTSSEWRATFDSNVLLAQHEKLICWLYAPTTSSSNYSISSNRIMLPFTETPFASQTVSSRVTNINPFLMITWNGSIDIFPPADSWNEMIDGADIFEEKTETVVVKRYVSAPCASYYDPGWWEPTPSAPTAPLLPPDPAPERLSTYQNTEISGIPPRTEGPPSNLGIVEALYNEVIGRAGEPAGVAYWQLGLDTGRYTTDTILNEFISAAQVTKEIDSAGNSTAGWFDKYQATTNIIPGWP